MHLLSHKSEFALDVNGQGEIYCYYAHHLTEIEAYLSRYQIPYYVRKAKDYWIVKYDKEADL